MAKKKRRGGLTSAHQEAVYTCDSCGEEIVVPVDISAGAHQDYVEDCPVCCHPMTLHVDIAPGGEAHIQVSTSSGKNHRGFKVIRVSAGVWCQGDHGLSRGLSRQPCDQQE